MDTLMKNTLGVSEAEWQARCDLAALYRICDHLGWPILINGSASIIHTRASDTAQNFAKEQGGYELNEVMWDNLRTVTLAADTIIGCYQELTEQLNPTWFGPHGHKIIDGMRGWLSAL